MAAGVKVSQFVAVERALVVDGLKWAPATLTAAERDWVPAVARDNFDTVIATRGTLSKAAFIRTFIGYLTAQANKADKQGNGILSAAEAKALPVDLRDNFQDAVRVTQGIDWKQAGQAQLTAAGRKALSQHVTGVLFNTRNPAGADFRSAVLDHRKPAQRQQLKQALLAEAAAWTPTGTDWSTSVWDTRTLVAEGRFGQLYTNLFFEQGLALPRVYLEID